MFNITRIKNTNNIHNPEFTCFLDEPKAFELLSRVRN